MTEKPLKPKEFEKSLAELNKLVEAMEQGGLSLEKSLENFATGVNLVRQCQQTLAQAEQRVKILTQNTEQE